MLKIVKTNNYFGQHDFILENVGDDVNVVNKLNEIKWTKKPSIVSDGVDIHIHCFTNYDKAKLEGAFANG